MIDLIITIATSIVLILVAVYDWCVLRKYTGGANKPPSGTPSGQPSGTPSEPNLATEYARYKQAAQILADTPGTNIYERRNSVERLMLTLANNTNNDTTSIFDQFAKEIESKQKLPRGSGRLAADHAKNILAKPIDTSTDTYNYKLAAGTFTYRDYTRTISATRMKLLRELAGDAAVAVMLMRYAQVLPGSQHWNIPLECYAELYAAGYRVEGFASPVNAQLLQYSDTGFCSLFPDTDAPFGSIGSFFGADFTGNATVVNPPFIDSMFTAVADKLEQSLHTDLPTKFFVTIAAWKDSAGYQRLLKLARFAAILPAGSHFYRNTNEPDEPKIIAKFPTAVFELAANLPLEPIEHYEKIMKSNSVGAFTYELLKHSGAQHR